MPKVKHNRLLFDVKHLFINPFAEIHEIVRLLPKDSTEAPIHEFGFSVAVPNECRAERCKHPMDSSSSAQHLVLHRQILPSTAIKSETTDSDGASDNDGTANKDEAADLIGITYNVHITLWENGTVKCYEDLPVLIKPKIQAISVPMRDSSGNQISAEKTWSIGRLCLKIAGTETTYLVWPPKAKSAPIVLMTKLSFLPMHPPKKMPPMNYVRTKLIQKTTFQELDAAERKKSTKTNVLNEKTFVVGHVKWSEYSMLSLTGGFEWVLWAPVPIQFPLGENMMTSFQSCIAGREFFAHVSFSFEGIGREIGIEVPINFDPCIEVSVAL
ncbi:uncharacterized protein N7511_001125 [Penicillium nucicola]|uniref:uncharacterized protein n=1 Tax=Penicillium nucicola TaxID=1850975 RepID=UPI0025458720|nr:uncharacterized protein N7511_001125 [Penicillium nucicola]KAJ5776114.1 hypothetical protein N7511_001125 [Penicillium nucicola]